MADSSEVCIHTNLWYRLCSPELCIGFDQSTTYSDLQGDLAYLVTSDLFLVLSTKTRLSLYNILDLHLLQSCPHSRLVGVPHLSLFLDLFQNDLNQVIWNIVFPPSEGVQYFQSFAPLLLFLLARRRWRTSLGKRVISGLLIVGAF